jgi:hypothetical protein
MGKPSFLSRVSVDTMLVFQLQRIIKDGELRVKGSLAFHGGFNPDVKAVFLASATFEFDLENTGTILKNRPLQFEKRIMEVCLTNDY